MNREPEASWDVLQVRSDTEMGPILALTFTYSTHSDEPFSILETLLHVGSPAGCLPSLPLIPLCRIGGGESTWLVSCSGQLISLCTNTSAFHCTVWHLTGGCWLHEGPLGWPSRDPDSTLRSATCRALLGKH